MISEAKAQKQKLYVAGAIHLCDRVHMIILCLRYIVIRIYKVRAWSKEHLSVISQVPRMLVKAHYKNITRILIALSSP